MKQPDMVTHSKAQLLAAVNAVEPGMRTAIQHNYKGGGSITYRFGRYTTEASLKRAMANIQRTPYVW